MKKNLSKTAIILVSSYISAQMIADIVAGKTVDFFGIYVPAAVFVYAITFTLRDAIHKQLGKQAAETVIITSGVINVLMALYLSFTVWLKPAPFWNMQDAYTSILGVVPRIAVASILAEVISELIDTQIYHLLRNKKPYIRVIGSNAVSLPVDSFIFVTFAFAGTMPWSNVLMLALGQVLMKAIVTVISIPIIYLVPEKKIYQDD